MANRLEIVFVDAYDSSDTSTLTGHDTTATRNRMTLQILVALTGTQQAT